MKHIEDIYIFSILTPHKVHHFGAATGLIIMVHWYKFTRLEVLQKNLTFSSVHGHFSLLILIFKGNKEGLPFA